MSWFKNLKVKAKMITSFSLVIALMVALAVFSIIEMNTVTGHYRYSIEHPIEAEIQMRIFDKEFGNMRRFVTTMALFASYNDAGRIDAYLDDANVAFSGAVAALNAYEDALTGGTMQEQDKQAALEQIAYARVTLEKYKKEVCDTVASESRAGDHDGAMQYIAAGVGFANELSAACGEFIKLAAASSDASVVSAEDESDRMVLLILGVSLAAAILSLITAFYISGLISKPLIPLASFMKTAGSTGDIVLRPEDLSVIGEYATIKDEIGQAINGAASFVDHVTNIAKELDIVANGDLTNEIDMLSNGDVMGKALTQMVVNLNKLFAEIHASTSQVSEGSIQVAQGAQSLAQGSTEQAASIEELSSSIAEIALKTRTNAETAEKAARLATSIIDNAEKGSRQMDEMMSSVQGINQASQNISKVIKAIDDIAFQTNILALNAAVEAARAGQHGKGFAVVAEEVRNLAGKSAEAAKETSSLIQDSIEKAELGTRIATETAASLSEIVTGINESSEFIAGIARASEEQSVGIDQINIGIDQVAQVVQQNSATAEESAAASEEMSGQSAMLQELISRFKLKNSYDAMALPLGFPTQKHRRAIPEKTGTTR